MMPLLATSFTVPSGGNDSAANSTTKITTVTKCNIKTAVPIHCPFGSSTLW